MKPNDKHTWAIRLYGSEPPYPVEKLYHYAEFVGTVDEALGQADELESEVDFEVGVILLSRISKSTTATTLTRAMTTKHSSRLGEIARHAGGHHPAVADDLDRGALLRRLLWEAGFGLVELPHEARKKP